MRELHFLAFFANSSAFFLASSRSLPVSESVILNASCNLATWELVGDYGTFRDLQRHRMVDAFEWQPLTPYYGYDVPDLVVEAGMEDEIS